MLIKLARIAVGATVKWNRIRKKNRGKDKEEEDEEHDAIDKVQYTSRKLACTRCGAKQETRWMQLRTKEGYRAVRCRTCGKQERNLKHTCQCGNNWHQCTLHRVDPAIHTSRKGFKNKKFGSATPVKYLSSERPAPQCEDNEASNKRARMTKKLLEEQVIIRHRKFVASTNPPNPALIEKIKKGWVKVEPAAQAIPHQILKLQTVRKAKGSEPMMPTERMSSNEYKYEKLQSKTRRNQR
jgi:hypothetical protein